MNQSDESRTHGACGTMHPDCRDGDPCPECEQPTIVIENWDGGTPHCRACDWTGWPADGEA